MKLFSSILFKHVGLTCRPVRHASPRQLGRWKSTTTINIDGSVEHGAMIPNIITSDVGVSSDIGKREYQEDRYTITRINEDILFLGIYDGHGGSLAVDYTTENLHTVTESLIKAKNAGFRDVLINAFCEVNNGLLQSIRRNRPKRERYSGTTATVCLLIDNVHLHTASVGDSRAILGRKGQSVALTHDHSPDREDEKLRVEKAGGTIISNSLGEPQVNGRLAMTRSIGDFDLKQHGVIAEPEYSYKKLNHSTDTCLALVTDGVTFSMTNEATLRVISSASTVKEAAHSVTDNSLQLGSQDNSTAVVLPLGAWGQYKPEHQTVHFQLGKMLSVRD